MVFEEKIIIFKEKKALALGKILFMNFKLKKEVEAMLLTFHLLTSHHTPLQKLISCQNH